MGRVTTREAILKLGGSAGEGSGSGGAGSSADGAGDGGGGRGGGQGGGGVSAIRSRDTLAAEEPLEIRVAGKQIAVTMRTPGDDFDLVAGYLVGEGVIRSPEQLTRMRFCGDSACSGPVGLHDHDTPHIQAPHDASHVQALHVQALHDAPRIQALHLRDHRTNAIDAGLHAHDTDPHADDADPHAHSADSHAHDLGPHAHGADSHAHSADPHAHGPRDNGHYDHDHGHDPDSHVLRGHDPYSHDLYNIIDVDLAPGTALPLWSLDRTTYTTSACGVCGKSSIEAVRANAHWSVESDPVRISPQTLYSLPKTLRAGQKLFAKTGGLHAAGLFTSDGELVCVREDVGRHNAVDKVVGWALRADRLPLRGHLLAVSGRASFELVQKAGAAGIPLLAAVSAPSSLAVELARESGMTLAGFVRGESANVYAGAERISLDGPTP